MQPIGFPYLENPKENLFTPICGKTAGFKPITWLAPLLYPFLYCKDPVKNLNKKLDNLESIPLDLNSLTSSHHTCLAVAGIVPDFLNFPQKERHLIDYKSAALKYRTEKLKPCVTYDDDACNFLKNCALTWKKDQIFFRSKAITEAEMEKIKELTSYKELFSLVSKNSEIREDFFKWCLLDKNPVNVWAEYPGLASKLTSHLLSDLIGSVGIKVLHITTRSEGNKLLKEVTLPFEGYPTNILDEERIVNFKKGNLSVSIKEVFESFKNKIFEIGNFSFFTSGFENWHIYKCGPYDANLKTHTPIDLYQEGSELLKNLPKPMQLTKNEAEERYSVPLDGKQWVIAACASRETLTTSPDLSHAYQEIAIPSEDGKSYFIYSFSKYPANFSPGVMTFLKFAGNTVPGAMAFPDNENINTKRQNAIFSVVTTPEDGLAFFKERIQKKIQWAATNNLHFQIGGDNCAADVQENFSEHFKDRFEIPNLFLMPFVDIDLPITKKIKTLPYQLHQIILKGLLTPLFPSRGMWIDNGKGREWKSLKTHSMWNTGFVYIPAFLHYQQQYLKIPVVAKKIDTTCLTPSNLQRITYV